MSDTYVSVTAKLVRVNPRSFIFENTEGEEVVVGRSCVHGVDEATIAASSSGDEIEFRVMEWLADKEGLR
jgi:hypothetical protein